MKARSLLVGLCGLLFVSFSAFARPPRADEIEEAHNWVAPRFAGNKIGEPGYAFFSFKYDGRPSSEFLSKWNVTEASIHIEGDLVRRTLVCLDPKTKLSMRCEAVEYRDYPVVEWTLYFKNTGKEPTPIISDIQALDAEFARPTAGGAGKYVLRHFSGSRDRDDDFEPHETVLGPNVEKRISAAGGRPTNSDLCYFNLELTAEQGCILGIGWPGQWAATFKRDSQCGIRVRAGQELTHFKLVPGEEVRSPLIALQFWKGDYLASQNVWRRWMIAHNLPRPGGKLPPIELAGCSSGQFGEMINANTENQKLFISRFKEEGFKLDYWWMDAGWYVNQSGWPNTGTWEVDTKRFPGGLRPICDHAHHLGTKTIVWFEPERVTGGTWLAEKHPAWLLRGPGDSLLDLGNPDARHWLTDHIDHLLTEQGIDLYRQDFNIDPLEHWRRHDTPDRQGITEIRYVTGYLAYWDELRRRHPNMLIDSCASGGRRNDLETLRRAVPLLRSDNHGTPIPEQGHTYGIAFWMPYNGTGCGAMDAYSIRSHFCPHLTIGYEMRNKDLPYATARRLTEEWRSVAPFLLGDYYPMTPFSLDPKAWIAWQFDRPEQGDGLVQAFRRPEAGAESLRVKFRGLDRAAVYALTNLDLPSKPEVKSGSELEDQGLNVTSKARPGAIVLVYKRKL